MYHNQAKENYNKMEIMLDNQFKFIATRLIIMIMTITMYCISIHFII